jgi:hypothetical protein
VAQPDRTCHPLRRPILLLPGLSLVEHQMRGAVLQASDRPFISGESGELGTGWGC